MIDAAFAKNIRPRELADEFVAANAVPAIATSAINAASRNDRVVVVVKLREVDVRRVGDKTLMRLLNEIKARSQRPGPKMIVRGLLEKACRRIASQLRAIPARERNKYFKTFPGS
jgi:hypothetical protein